MSTSITTTIATSTPPAHRARSFHHASKLPKEVWRALSQNEAAANVVLPFARKALYETACNEHLWIEVSDVAKNVEFVLSCTKGPLGNYPIFIVACKSAAQLAQQEQGDSAITDYLTDALTPLVSCLLREVPPSRVFSVFSIAPVSARFAEIFEAQTRAQHNIRAIAEPYYDATFTYCTSDTLRKPPSDTTAAFPGSEGLVITLRRADMSHLRHLAAMCKAFSETSPPFELDDARAEQEARLMIDKQQVWVHLVQTSSLPEPEVACLVATTRESDNVTAVTKVFTTEGWRGHGCAARLMYRVCHDLLQKKKRVVLYVGNSDELASARKVYHKVGFQGLGDTSEQSQIDGVERWIEIGFEGTELGYW